MATNPNCDKCLHARPKSCWGVYCEKWKGYMKGVMECMYFKPSDPQERLYSSYQSTTVDSTGRGD